jgi:hypothetical protein
MQEKWNWSWESLIWKPWGLKPQDCCLPERKVSCTSITHGQCCTYPGPESYWLYSQQYLKILRLSSALGKPQRHISALLPFKACAFQKNEVVSILCEVRISLLGCVHSGGAPLSWESNDLVSLDKLGMEPWLSHGQGTWRVRTGRYYILSPASGTSELKHSVGDGAQYILDVFCY